MKCDDMILGANCKVSTDSQVTQLNNNVVVVGGSGSGKTVSVAEPVLLETYNSSVVTTLTKRRLFDMYAPLFERRGYQVYDLNFVEPEKANVAFDPLKYIKGQSDISFLARSIVLSNPKKEGSTLDPYWDDAAQSLLSAEIGYVLETKENPTFADVMDFHKYVKPTNNYSADVIFKSLEDENPESFACQCWKTFSCLPEKTSSCVYSTLQSVLDKVFVPELTEMIRNAGKLDIPKLSQEKSIMFITTSPVNEAMNGFVNLFYSQIFKELFEYAESLPTGELPRPVNLLCDDFATGTRIPSFAQYISVIREKKISVVLLLQSESQLISLYGRNEATTVVNNCDTYIYLGGMDVETASNISVKANLPLNEVLNMKIGKEILIRRGCEPKMLNRYDTPNNKLRQQLEENYERRLQVCQTLGSMEPKLTR